MEKEGSLDVEKRGKKGLQVLGKEEEGWRYWKKRKEGLQVLEKEGKRVVDGGKRKKVGDITIYNPFFLFGDITIYNPLFLFFQQVLEKEEKRVVDGGKRGKGRRCWKKRERGL